MINSSTPVCRLGELLGWFGRANRHREGNARRRRSVLEALEPRRLLALGAQFATVASGSPVITQSDLAGAAVATAEDASGDTYVAATYNNTVTFPGLGTITGDSSGDYSYVAKFSPSGQALWVHNIFDLLDLRVAVDPSGDLYVSGNTPTAGKVTIDPAGHLGFSGPGTTYSPVPGNNVGDIMLEVIKFAPNGSLAWGTNTPTRIFSGLPGQMLTAAVYAGSITTDSSGNVYVSGFVNDTSNNGGVGSGFAQGSQGLWQYNDPNFNTSNQVIPSQTDEDGDNAFYFFATKLDSNGNNLWATPIASGYSDIVVNNGARIAVGATGEVYVTDADDSSGSPEVELSQLSSGDGGLAGPVTVISGPTIVGNEVAVGSNGYVYIAGSFGGTVSLGGGGSFPQLTAKAEDDIYIVALDVFTDQFGLDFNVESALQYGQGASSINGATALMSDGTSGMYVAGTFQNALPVGSQTLTSQGSSDLFLALDTPQNTLTQAQDIGGSRGYAYSSPALAIGSSGHVAVAAVYQGSGGSPTFSGATLPAGGGVIAAVLANNPIVTVSAPSVVTTSNPFNVSWSARSPIDTAIASYNVLVSDNGGPFTPLLSKTQLTQYSFMGVNGHTYGFEVTATDANGLVSLTPSAPQAVTLVQYTTTNSPGSGSGSGSGPGSSTNNVMAATPSPTPPQMTGLGATNSKKGITSLAITFNEPMDASSASSQGLYQVYGGVKKVVKKHRQTVFSKPLGIKSIMLNGSGTTVTITLAKPYKGVVQVTTLAGVKAANGASSTSTFSMDAS